MIYIDDRTGSKDLYDLFPRGMAELTRLVYGDLCFLGRGPGDAPLSIGFERKRIHDLVNSLADGRLSGHQLPGLVNCYDVVYLLVEGVWRSSEGGVLEYYSKGEWKPLVLGSRQFLSQEVYNYLNSLTIFAGVVFYTTGSAQETVRVVLALHHWWNDKGFYSHVSHRQAHRPFVSIGNILQKSLVFKIALELPGVGPERAAEVVKHFNSVMDMVLAGPERWLRIPGFGEKLSERLPKLLQEGKGGNK